MLGKLKKILKLIGNNAVKVWKFIISKSKGLFKKCSKLLKEIKLKDINRKEANTQNVNGRLEGRRVSRLRKIKIRFDQQV